jgi:hypothetical protein
MDVTIPKSLELLHRRLYGNRPKGPIIVRAPIITQRRAGSRHVTPTPMIREDF